MQQFSSNYINDQDVKPAKL